MAKFLFVYHLSDPMPVDKTEVAANMTKWESWMGSLGDAMVDPGHPVGKSSTVSAGGVAQNGGPNPVAGFSIFEAGDLDAALEAAKSCPIIEGGTVEVAPIVEM